MSATPAATWDLRRGHYASVLANDTWDAAIFDAPYSERTHRGHDDGISRLNRVPDAKRRVRVDRRDGSVYAVGAQQRRTISYGFWTEDDVERCVEFLVPRTRGWIVSITDHILALAWERALLRARRYVFPPVPLVERGSSVRMTGDGPSSWTRWVIVARPKTRTFQGWGTLQGSYVVPTEPKPVIGGKTLRAMREIVADYSRPGDVVCDVCAGGGTTLLAAVLEGRRALGAEMDREAYFVARERLRREAA